MKAKLLNLKQNWQELIVNTILSIFTLFVVSALIFQLTMVGLELAGKTERKSALKPSSAKAKGRVLQQAVRDLILAKFNLEQDDVRSVSMGATGEDLLLSPAARRQLPISLECKSRASISVYGFYEQAKANAGGYEPVVVVKQNRDKPLVVVDCVYFFELLRRASNE